MAIDGRTLKQQPPDAATEAYNSKGLSLVAALIIWVPLLLFLWFTYWTGTFFGGVLGGLGSVLSTAATIAVVYFLRRARRSG
ncbi:MAG TPA: hypothetical protein VGK50_04340 [Coriobacteriia bacterium]|jgi:hypothetical protein